MLLWCKKSVHRLTVLSTISEDLNIKNICTTNRKQFLRFLANIFLFLSHSKCRRFIEKLMRPRCASVIRLIGTAIRTADVRPTVRHASVIRGCWFPDQTLVARVTKVSKSATKRKAGVSGGRDRISEIPTAGLCGTNWYY